jgi:hypothetical protein
MIGFIGAPRSRPYASFNIFFRSSRGRRHQTHVPSAGVFEGPGITVDSCWRCWVSLRSTRFVIFFDFRVRVVRGECRVTRVE